MYGMMLKLRFSMQWLSICVILLISVATSPVHAVKAPAPMLVAVKVFAPLYGAPDTSREAVSVLTPPKDAKCPEFWALTILAGFTFDEATIVDGLMWRESRCDIYYPTWNRDDPNGGSRGLLQINGSWTKWLKHIEDTPIDSAEDLFDPAINLWAARQIYLYGVQKHGTGWGPWRP